MSFITWWRSHLKGQKRCPYCLRWSGRECVRCASCGIGMIAGIADEPTLSLSIPIYELISIPSLKWSIDPIKYGNSDEPSFNSPVISYPDEIRNFVFNRLRNAGVPVDKNVCCTQGILIQRPYTGHSLGFDYYALRLASS